MSVVREDSIPCIVVAMQEELGTYNAVMTEVGQALLAAGSQLLAPRNVAQLDFEGEADDFGQYLCETMALYGASHLHCIGGPDRKVLFLQQVRAECSHPSTWIYWRTTVAHVCSGSSCMCALEQAMVSIAQMPMYNMPPSSRYVCKGYTQFPSSSPEGVDLRLQMLAFLQHPYMLLAAKAMAFWTSLLSSSERAAGRAEPLTPESTPIPLDCVAALMDLAGKHLACMVLGDPPPLTPTNGLPDSMGQYWISSILPCCKYADHYLPC